VHVAARCPAIMGRHPDVTRLNAGPVTGAPGVAVAAPHPDAGDVEAIRRRRRARWSDFGRSRGSRQVRDGGLATIVRRRGPVTGPPLPARAGLAPVAGAPALAGRRRSPDTADPQEVAALVVPGPVAADPGRPLRLVVWGQLVEWLRGRLGHGRRRHGLA